MKFSKTQIIISVVALAAIGAYLWWRYRGNSYEPSFPAPDTASGPDYSESNPVMPPGQSTDMKPPDLKPWRDNYPINWEAFTYAIYRLMPLIDEHYAGGEQGFYKDYHRKVLGFLKGFDLVPSAKNIDWLRPIIAQYLNAGGYHDPEAIKAGQWEGLGPIGNQNATAIDANGYPLIDWTPTLQ